MVSSSSLWCSALACAGIGAGGAGAGAMLAVCVRDLTLSISSGTTVWSGERAHGMGCVVLGAEN